MGSRRVRTGGDPFKQLITDHRKILGVLDQMRACDTESGLRRSALYLMLKRKLAKHAMAEEDVVYPIVHGSAEGDRRKHLYDEHADMKILLFDLEEKLKNRSDWTSTVRRLRDLVHQHADEEETIIFPQLRQQLGRENSPRVSGQISREEAMIV
jgi:iron-sulfur cluster repair protein YtfE (RIC family)